MNNWPGFHTPSLGLLALLAIPLVVVYFLKLKRPRYQVPSLVLWQQVMNDSRVNSPFQRFKRNILLWLQLALLALLVLAAMQPYWMGQSDNARYLPILIDASASMAAVDSDGESRLDVAKERIDQIIAGLRSDQEVTLIAFGNSATRLCPFTNNKRILRDALSNLNVDDVAGSPEDALRMAQSLARSYAFKNVMMYSDGNFPSRTDFELSFTLDFQQLPAADANFGITEMNAQRSKSMEGWDVYVRIQGSAEATSGGVVEMFQDGESVGTEDILIEADREKRLVFQVSGDQPTSLRIELQPDNFDSLEADNVAYLDLPVARTLRVFVPKKLAAYRHALRGMKGLFLFPPDDGEEDRSQAYDLVIGETVDDMDIAASCYMSIGLVPEDFNAAISVTAEGTDIADWSQDNPLLQHVSLGDIIILDRPTLQPDTTLGDLESMGYRAIIHGQHGPLMLERRVGKEIHYTQLFHSTRSTLPYRVGFPVMLSNLVRISMFNAGLSQAHPRRTGAIEPLARAANQTYRMVGPDGEQVSESTDDNGMLPALPASRVGEYRIERGSEPDSTIGVSLLSGLETSLASVDQIMFNELSVAAADSQTQLDRSLWPTLAFLAFCLLLVEWWFFQRRPGGFTQ